MREKQVVSRLEILYHTYLGPGTFGTTHMVGSWLGRDGVGTGHYQRLRRGVC